MPSALLSLFAKLPPDPELCSECVRCPRVSPGLGCSPMHFAVGAGGPCFPRSTVEANSLHLSWWDFGILGSEQQVC